MPCKFKHICPCSTKQREGSEQDFEKCIPFLVFVANRREDRIQKYESAMKFVYEDKAKYGSQL